MSGHQVSCLFSYCAVPLVPPHKREISHQKLTLDESLALCELYFAVVVLVLRVYPRMQLFETTIDDVKLYRDLFVPIFKDGRKGVQVFITE